MSLSVTLPAAPPAGDLRRHRVTPAVHRHHVPNPTARAILAELRRHAGSAPAESVADFPPQPGDAGRSPVLVHAGAAGDPDGPVVVALDDDDNPGALIGVGAAEAARRGVPLRVAYVWTDCRPPDCPHHLVCHRDLGQAAGLLAAIVDTHLPIGATTGVERDVLHSTDPAPALIGLSAHASLLVVGASSYGPLSGKLLGDTVKALVGRTSCPLVVVPHRGARKQQPAW